MIRKEWMNPKSLSFENDYETAMFYKHFAPYLYVNDFVKNKEVLELGCGAGYGIDYLSNNAKRIVTVDIDSESIEHAKQNSEATNIEYILQDILDGLRFQDNSFDVVISFQVIEHFNKRDVKRYLNEIFRLLKPDGTAFITTPNREIRLFPFQKPVNKYHPLEYSHYTLRRLIKQFFPCHEILVLRSKNEIEEIFNNRRKMNAIQVFIVKPIRRIVLKTLKLFRINGLVAYFEKRSIYSRPFHSLNIGEINSDSFRFENEELRKGLDFIIICNKCER
jgi:2-polyprenyl-3-methyl-5-hydroxy-6-metoxy-1,4-benzoquinol methylase